MTERDKLEEMKEYYIEKEVLYLLNGEELMNVTIEAPAVDVVKVVRCKDCKHLMTDVSVEYTPYGFENDIREYGCKRIFDLTGEWVDVMLDDFCSYGERKDGEE